MFAVRLLSNKSQNMSKFGKGINVLHSPNDSFATYKFLPHFDARQHGIDILVEWDQEKLLLL